MDILRRAIAVKFTRLSETDDTEATALVFPWQSLRFQLRITFSNENGEHDRDGAALMAAIGENDFGLVWKRLFHTVRIVPFVLESAATPSPSALQETLGQQSQRSTYNEPQDVNSGVFTFGAPSFWENGAFVETPTTSAAPSISTALGKAFTLVEKLETSTLAPEVASSVTDSSVTTLNPAVPRHMVSTYMFNFNLPSLEDCRESVMIGFVVLLPFSCKDKYIGEKNGEGNDNDDIILRSLLFMEERKTVWFRPSSVMLGTFYYHAQVGRLLHCTSVSRRAPHLRVLVNVNVANVVSFPVCLHQVSFDIFSSWIGESLGSLSRIPLWSEQRAGPRGADMKTIELLRRIVTVTPIVVPEFHVPISLQPGESMNFQFSIQVRSHLCYLLEQHSLQEVYGKFMNEPAKKYVSEKEIKTAASCCYSSPSAVLKDVTTPASPLAPWNVTAREIWRDELIQALSLRFTSHVYVYYEPLPSVGRDCGKVMTGTLDDTKVCTNLQLRHPVHWSILQ